MDNLRSGALMNLVLILGALLSLVFSVLTFAFGGDIALYTMAVKNDIFWESEYGYSDWNATTENGSTETTYHTEANTLETDAIDFIMDIVTTVSIIGSIVTLVIIALVFFRKPEGVIYMFNDIQKSK